MQSGRTVFSGFLSCSCFEIELKFLTVFLHIIILSVKYDKIIAFYNFNDGVLCTVCGALVYFCMLVKQMWIMVLIYTFTLFKIVFFYPDDSSKTLKRPCLFCGKFLAKLKRHLISNHSKEEEVSNALKLPKHLQNRQFAKMRKAGIFKVNAEKMKSEEK